MTRTLPPIPSPSHRASRRARFGVPAALALGLMSAGATSGCAPAAAGGDEPVGEAHLAVTTVPPAVQCIQISATNGSQPVTRNLPVTSGSSSIGLSLGQLPVGTVTISGQAFSQTCSAISGQTATWIADSQQIVLQPGVVRSVVINFRPNNSVGGTANFVGNLAQVALGNPKTVSVVLSDGTVRASGNWVLGFSEGTFAPVTALTSVSQLAWGSSTFGCVIHINGSVECFGDNTNGYLGNGTTTASTTPVLVGGGVVTDAVQLSLGGASCAIDRHDGLFCWGRNFSGQVGNGTTTNVLTPVRVEPNAVSVATGVDTTCAIMAAGGQVKCWGNNFYGQVGNGTNNNTTSPLPINVAGATQLALGDSHSCALKGDGTVKCWGDNNFGQLGTGTFSGSSVPVTVPGLTTVQQIVALSYATCARKANGSVWCWGQDVNGELGDGTGTTSNVPVQVPGLPPSASLAAGPTDVCSLGTNQSLYCWGLNGAGQFGNGTRAAALTPVQVNP